MRSSWGCQHGWGHYKKHPKKANRKRNESQSKALRKIIERNTLRFISTESGESLTGQQNRIDRVPAVALLVARQVGKTTLARALAEQRDSIYLDLEIPRDQLKLRDPEGYLRLHDDKLIVLDEIQRSPDLFNILRGIIDENRQAGRLSGQFLILGSASMDLLRQSSESPAGRISYIDILNDLFLIRRLRPGHADIKKRLVKSPRYYIRDSGIQHRLLGIDSYDDLLSSPVLGKSWEGFVVENIHSVLPRRARTSFYRTAAGAEIDLVIDLPGPEVWAVEIKYGTAPKFAKHFSRTCDDIGAARKFVVYGGDDITMISLSGIMERLLEAGRHPGRRLHPSLN